MDRIGEIIEFESGELADKQTVKMFQKMINDGSVWSMQGSYGRTAMELLEAGLCELGKKPCHDYYGNRVPSRYEVESGTRGASLKTRKN